MKLEEFLNLDIKKLNIENKKDYLEIQNILSRSDASLGRLLEEPCEKCGEKQVYCGQYDQGAVNYEDSFWHLCLNCLTTQYSTSSNGMPSHISCPFCGYQWA